MKISFFTVAPLAIAVVAIVMNIQVRSGFVKKKINRIHNQTKEYAFATVTTPAFCMGAIALAQSLRNNHEDKYDYLCLVTKDVNAKWRRILSQWWRVVEVPEKKPHYWFRRSWIKLNLWTFTEYKKIVYLDTDTLCFANLDALFKEPELSCVADVSPPQICNTGVLVLDPNMTTYYDMLRKSKFPSLNNPPGDQGFINAYFGHFNSLPAVYNVPRLDTMGFADFYMNNKIKIVHFVCKKPWKCGREGVDYCGCGEPELNVIWYKIFDQACKDHECIETWAE